MPRLRGLNRQRRYLVVIDGSKALRAGVWNVFSVNKWNATGLLEAEKKLRRIKGMDSL
jgi:hypothetical protein